MAIHATAGLSVFQTPDFPRRSSCTPRGGTPRESLCNFPLLYDGSRRYSSAIYAGVHPEVRSLVSPQPSVLSLQDESALSIDERFRQNERICIKVRGAKFETYKATLEQFPDTLLGSSGARCRFYDPDLDALVFDRDPASFDAILFFYQSKGRILARPDFVDEDIFSEEIEFYGLLDDEDPETQSIASAEDIFTGHFASIRRKMWNVFENPSDSKCGKFVARFSMLVIILSVIAFCLDTVPGLGGNAIQDKQNSAAEQANSTHTDNKKNGAFLEPELVERRPGWFALDTVFVVFFTLEYSIRVFAAPSRLRFVRSFLAVVDFIAIAPYYISFIVMNGKLQNVKSFNVVRAVRLFRVMRLFKLYRYSRALKLLGRALLQSKEKMGTLLLCVMMAVILFSSVLYYVEGFGEDGSDFESIPASFWWAIITMSTVGYGDIVPVTALGKLIAAFCAFAGIILLYILPIPVFVSHFSQIYQKWRMKRGRTKDSNEIGLKYKVALW